MTSVSMPCINPAEVLSRDEALALQGSGFDYTNDEIESFSES